MERNTERNTGRKVNRKLETKSANTRLTVQIIIAVLFCAAVMFSKGKSEYPYSEMNKCTSYLFFHSSDIRGAYDRIMESVHGFLPDKESAGGDSPEDGNVDENNAGAETDNTLSDGVQDENSAVENDGSENGGETDSSGADGQTGENAAIESAGSENGGGYDN